MRFFLEPAIMLCGLFFSIQLFAQTPSAAVKKDSMNPILEAKIGARLAVIHTELAKIEQLLADSTQIGYFSSILNDSVAATYYRLDASWSEVSGRTVWPVDSSILATLDTMSVQPEWPRPDTSMQGGGFGGGKNPFSMFRKKSPRTVFTWGFSWGVADVVGKAVPSVTDWQYLNLNHTVKAQINQDLCIQCGRCHIACEDTSHQAISHLKDGRRHYEVKEEECVGCNLCAVVCPVEGCITLQPLTAGVDPRTGVRVGGHRTWLEHPNNPMAKPAERALEPAE